MKRIPMITGAYPVLNVLENINSEIENGLIKTMLNYKLYNQLMIIKFRYD